MSFLVPKNSNADPPIWIRALFTKPATPDETAYFAAYGRFVAAFALAEAALHVAARHFSGISEENARVIFGGLNRGELGEIVRKLTMNTSQHEEVDALVKQLEAIAKERNKLVHRMVEYDPKEGLKVSNSLTVKVVEKVENKTFSISDLNDMEDDCKRIFIRFGLLRGEIDHDRMTAYGFSVLGMSGPWRYQRTGS
jgi:hypothetical protein